jgi:hypothetical protein
MSNKTYDILKFIAQVVLPAVTTFYGVLGATLNIPHTQEVITIAVAFDTMLGTILGISSKKYHESEGEDNAENE